MSRIYLVCPVRQATPEQTAAIREYVAKLEAQGHCVHWPARDTVQEDDTNGWQVCEENARAIIEADEVHVWWDPRSQGSVFDLGIAWALRMLAFYPPAWAREPILVLANTFDVPPGKCLEKVLRRWAEESGGA